MGIGEPLIGRFLIYDALRMKFRELKLKKDPDCPVCGTHPTVTALIDYEQFCGVAPAAQEVAVNTASNDTETDVTELKRKIDANEDFFLLDVSGRTSSNRSHSRLTWIPAGEVRSGGRDSPRQEIGALQDGPQRKAASSFGSRSPTSRIERRDLDWSTNTRPSRVLTPGTRRGTLPRA